MIDIDLKTAAAVGMDSWITPLHGVNGKVLTAVHSDDELTVIALNFADGWSLIFDAEPDDDTVSIRSSREQPTTTKQNMSEAEPWKQMVGKPIGWLWAMMNQQGHVDGILLSSGGVVPEIVATVVASSFKIGRVTEQEHPC